MATTEIGGDCYVAAVHLLMRLDDSAVLCHGTVTGTGGEVLGQRYGHAWIECEGFVHDHSNGHKLTAWRTTYYRIGQIDATNIKRYTRAQAAVEMLRTGHYGPWDDDDAQK
jgi:hypothetical protein